MHERCHCVGSPTWVVLVYCPEYRFQVVFVSIESLVDVGRFFSIVPPVGHLQLFKGRVVFNESSLFVQRYDVRPQTPPRQAHVHHIGHSFTPVCHFDQTWKRTPRIKWLSPSVRDSHFSENNAPVKFSSSVDWVCNGSFQKKATALR